MNELYKNFTTLLFDLYLYWPPVFFKALIKTLRWAIVTIIGYLTIFNIGAIVMSYFRDGKVKWESFFPPYFFDATPWIIGIIFLLIIMAEVAYENRRLISKTEPGRYVSIKPYNPPAHTVNGVGFVVKNNNPDYAIFVKFKIMAIQHSRTFLYRYNSDDDFRDIPELVDERHGTSVGNGNMTPYSEKILEMVNWEKGGKLTWKVRPQDDSKLPARFKQNTKYIIHCDVYGETNFDYPSAQDFSTRYSVEIEYKNDKLVIKEFKGTPVEL